MQCCEQRVNLLRQDDSDAELMFRADDRAQFSNLSHCHLSSVYMYWARPIEIHFTDQVYQN